MYCATCGREGRAGAAFCEGCGNPFPVDPGPSVPPQPADGCAGARPPFPDEADVVCFVGEKSGYYLGKFRNFQVGRVETFAATWNWSAFCFTNGWLLYRKMYLWALLSFVASCIPFVGLVVWIATGVSGNYLYYRHVSSKIAEARAVTPEGDIPRVLAQLGGVHRWVIWVGVAAALLALLGILAAVSIPFFFGGTRGGRAI